MSSNSTPSDTPIQPLHHPQQAAHVVVPQAPLGNVVNQGPGAGAQALLAKKMAKNPNPTFSPTDNLMTPVSQKLSAAKKKNFSKGRKPVQLFATGPPKEDSSDGDVDDDMAIDPKTQQTPTTLQDDDNPF